jgi:alanine racemase
MPQPLTYAKINLSNLRYNFRSVSDYSGTKLICVSKADSYGHGAAICVPALYRAGARFFAVSSIIEALGLRECLRGTEESDPADILIFGATFPSDASEIIENNFIQTIYDREYAALLAAKIPAGKKLRVHIKLDTGMNRLGFGTSDRDIGDIAAVCADERFSCEGLYSHFACSDEMNERGLKLTDSQFTRYKKVETTLASKGITFSVRHIRNSAASLFHPETALDCARAGIVLYGLTPSEELNPPITLKPVMDLCTTVTHIHTLHAGESVSYGAIFTAERDMRVATLAIGYADGYIRAYRGATVRIRGVDCPILGRICMDQCICAVDTVPDAMLGDEALLFGENKPVEELSKLANTINYECVCLVGKRIPRIPVNDLD